MLPDFGDRRITRAVQDLVDTLERKGREYRNASLEPVRIASDLEPEQRIRSRIDEKLARLKAAPRHTDTIRDLAGCFVLLLAALDGDDFPTSGTGHDVAPRADDRARDLADGPAAVGTPGVGPLRYDGE